MRRASASSRRMTAARISSPITARSRAPASSRSRKARRSPTTRRKARRARRRPTSSRCKVVVATKAGFGRLFLFQGRYRLIVASGIAMQFGPQVLFASVTLKFGGGNRYGLIGANGSGKSTFLKILGGELEPSAGSVSIDSNERVDRLGQYPLASVIARAVYGVL